MRTCLSKQVVLPDFKPLNWILLATGDLRMNHKTDHEQLDCNDGDPDTGHRVSDYNQ